MASIFTDLDTGSDQDLFTALSTMTSEAKLPSALRNVRSLTFDLMGTCVDWHTSIVHALHSIPQPRSSDPVDPSQLAKDWRAGFFQTTFDSFQRGEHNPDMDVVHRQVLDRLLGDRGVGHDVWNDEVRERLVRAWHHQSGELRCSRLA